MTQHNRDIIQITPASPEIQYFAIEKEHFTGTKTVDQKLWTPDNISIHQCSIMPDEYLDVNKHLSAFNRTKKDTTILNFQAGTGKTTLLHQLIKLYLLDHEKTYVVFYCAPFRRLLAQNETDINKLNLIPGRKISVKNCVESLVAAKSVEDDKADDYVHTYSFGDVLSDVYLMTPEFLLASGGKRYRPQSNSRAAAKAKLLSTIAHQKAKVILILDEVHEKTNLYSSLRLAHLYRLKPVLQKIIIASATFTLESVEVIKAASLLTGRKIDVFQADRQKNTEDKLAALHLHVCTHPYKKGDLKSLEPGLIEVLKTCSGPVHILTASKELTQSLRHSSNEDLRLIVDNLNFLEVTGERKNQFNESRNHIGTTFSTGINITKTDSTLILILPGTIPATSDQLNTKDPQYGVFSTGLIGLVQSVARLRNAGTIHIFMPRFANYLANSCNELDTELRSIILKTGYTPSLLKDIEEGSFDNFINSYSEDEAVFKDFWISLTDPKKGLSKELSEAQKSYFGFESRYDYILSEYANYRMATSYREGKQLSPLLFWMAFNDQFTNCTLKDITIEYDAVLLPEKSKLTKYFGDILEERWAKKDTNQVDKTIFEALESVLNALSYKEGLKEEINYNFSGKRGTIKVLFKESVAVAQSLFSIAFAQRGLKKPTAGKCFDFLMEEALLPQPTNEFVTPFQQLAKAISDCQMAIRQNSKNRKGNDYILADISQYAEISAWIKVRDALSELNNSPLTNNTIAPPPLYSKTGSTIDDVVADLVFVKTFASRVLSARNSPFAKGQPYRKLTSQTDDLAELL